MQERKRMDEVKSTKNSIRAEITEKVATLSESERTEKTSMIETKLFEFANFIESRIIFLYVHKPHEMITTNILQQTLEHNKILVLPAFNAARREIIPLKVDNLKTNLKPGARGIMEPDRKHCKKVPIEYLDIAIIPGTAFDEKGGRVGSGEGYYDRFIPKLSITTRKVALAYECQLLPQVPMESHDKHVDIIITEERVIYKI